jgi:hypothetical protein
MHTEMGKSKESQHWEIDEHVDLLDLLNPAPVPLIPMLLGFAR